MESPEILTDPGSKKFCEVQKNKPRIIVVVADASLKELQLAPLKHALDIAEPGDKLYLLGILHQVRNPSTSPPTKSIQASMFQNILGYKQKADSTSFGGTNNVYIQEGIRKKTADFQKCMAHPELQQLFTSKLVKPEIQIAAGGDRKLAIATEAKNLQANWVILDKSLKGDKSYLVEQLNCNLVLMSKKQTPSMIRTEIPSITNMAWHGENNERSTSPGSQFQDHLDNSKDLGPGPIGKISPRLLSEVSRQFSQISLASAQSLSSSISLRNSGKKTLSPVADEYSRSESQSQAELMDSYAPPVQLAKDDASSPAHIISPSELSEDDTVADLDENLQHQLGPGVTSVSEKVLSEDLEHNSFNPLAKVADGIPSSGVIHKMRRRSSMSTGDLQSLVTAGPSGVTLYRPSPRSASDRGGEELMRIMNPSPSTSSGVETSKSVRTLQSSLEEDNDRGGEELMKIMNSSPSTSFGVETPRPGRTLQTSLEEDSNGIPDVSSSPLGKVNKFGSQDEDNRPSEDSVAPARRKRAFAALCSKCNKPSPECGTDAIEFAYATLEEATNNFDQENYIAEGGYGFVYRGTLKSLQEIAVKQYKAASSQGDDEFYSEVDVLKHAQHRNLVNLIGYCTENNRRLLVYEYVCNKSLDVHLSAKNVTVLEWKSRWKIAIGAARGLRYLHEECRVGCIVHRDMRPNNILLTHDFNPMVGDFGLARSQSGDDPEETRVIGTLGYLAPEYAASARITEKADVYSFGVVLLELITGRKAIDATRARGETCLTEWARPILQAGMIGDLVDPRLKGDYIFEQVEKMVDAASRCISKEPSDRPKMSEVLRLLEHESGSSISRASSSSSLIGELPRNPSLTRIATSKGHIGRQGSLDSSPSKRNTKSNGAFSIQAAKVSKSLTIFTDSPRRRGSSKPEKASSPRSRPSSNSPGGQKSQYSKTRARTANQLSYSDML